MVTARERRGESPKVSSPQRQDRAVNSPVPAQGTSGSLTPSDLLYWAVQYCQYLLLLTFPTSFKKQKASKQTTRKTQSLAGYSYTRRCKEQPRLGGTHTAAATTWTTRDVPSLKQIIFPPPSVFRLYNLTWSVLLTLSQAEEFNCFKFFTHFVIPLLLSERLTGICIFLDDNEVRFKSKHFHIKGNYESLRSSSCYKRWRRK